MKKINHPELQESYYIETLDNGLQVIIFHKPEFVTTTAAIATPYGSCDFSQIDDNGNVIAFTPGIAHFLEHKMFESEKGDIMDIFSQLGASVNAFTSMTETVYYFSISSNEVKIPLELLLDFVQRLEISEESVEKEKGIIAEELKMYLQMPDIRLIFELLKNIYQNHPIQYDIGGSVDSIYRITKEDLINCHQINYHPSKMVLVISSPINPKYLLQIIVENQKAKSFPIVRNVKRFYTSEPLQCALNKNEIEMEVAQNKISLAFKINLAEIDLKKRLKTEWALKYLLDAHYSSMNPQYQSWIDEKKINDFFGYEVSIGEDFGFIIFYGEHEYTEIFVDFILESWKTIQDSIMNEEQLTRLKNRYFGQTIMLLNVMGEICFSYIRSAFAGVSFFDSVKLIQEIGLADVVTSYQLIDTENHTILKIMKKN